MELNRLQNRKKDDGFTVRTVMAMATEMAEARTALNMACVQFAALASALDVRVIFDPPL